ncbi:hypothetical protein MARGE09_P2489 [Marinagarivorans cellulosilyticus]|uniref:Outer membrane protein beta-barrel domain-containing protein n=2 Tax=Marinagarivorans cellulosilyticus TaxID=2721545 RepID=A0AAN1WIK6_9GAMM|nr:hypothetical protein MARGE09_P2489 [Marinagarivorans cellulosilyticus]
MPALLNNSLGKIMFRQKNTVVWAASIMLCSIASAASAMELSISQGYRDGGKFEADIPPVSYSLAGGPATSIVLGHELDAKRTLEFLYSHQSTSLRNDRTRETLLDLGIDYYHIGGTNEISRSGDTVFFGSGGLGATHFSPSGDYYSETRFSVSFGLGAKHSIGERLILRADGKLFGTFLDSGSGIFCGVGTSGNGCSIAVSGTLAVQYEISAGIGFKF